MEEEKVQDLVNELSQDISRDAKIRETVKIWTIRIAVFSLFSFILGVSAYLLYLNFSLRKIERELTQKQNTIDDLESSLNSLMYAEQIREEDGLKISDLGKSFADQTSNSRLESQVLFNLRELEAASEGYKGRNISRGNESFPEIALTFDLASGDELKTIQDLIQKYKIKCTIFLSNERASDTSGSFFLASNLNRIKEMAKSNQVEFGNHTWSHFNYVRSIHERSPQKRKVLEYISKEPLSLEKMAEELYRVETQFKSLTGKELTKYYRLPYGAVNSLLLDAHAAIGYKDHIMWSRNKVGSLDLPDYIYKQFITISNEKGKPIVVKNPYYKTQAETLEFLYEWEEKDPNGMNGAILLMHLGSPRKFDKLIEILPEFVTKMQKKGYQFVTVSEVLNDEFDRN